MIRYRLDLNYVGTSYLGWQTQPSGDAVQDHLDRALATVLGNPIRTVGASRTDSGVHAMQQVAVFDSEQTFECRKLKRSLNAVLPEAIRVHALQAVDSKFHPIVSATRKVYRYTIWNGEEMPSWLHPFAWDVPFKLDLDLMRSEAKSFVGTHDFLAFCAVDGSAKTSVRTIFEIEIESSKDLITVWISGGGFLKQMCRCMVGTLIDIARGRKNYDAGLVSRLLTAPDRKAAGKTAPPQGLTLAKIDYGSETSISSLIDRAKTGFCMPIPAID
jgi:tRNA pseudouridine38-40 synthase